MTKELRMLTISPDLEVSLKWLEIMNIEAAGGEDESSVRQFQHSVDGNAKPHKDLLDAFKTLKKFALEINEIDLDSKQLGSWTVSGLKISGDVLTKQSRAVLTLSHFVKRTGKTVEMPTSQVTMYPENDEASKYINADKLANAIEKVIDEVWLYLGGKFDPEETIQLALFPEREAVEA